MDVEARRAFVESTGRFLTPKVMDWIRDLVERWGDDRVADAIYEAARTGKLESVLSRARDELAKHDAITRSRPLPEFVPPERLMAIMNGEEPMPPHGVYFDAQDLTPTQYTRAIEWHVARHGLAS